jgi:hypothetical protein
VPKKGKSSPTQGPQEQMVVLTTAGSEEGRAWPQETPHRRGGLRRRQGESRARRRSWTGRTGSRSGQITLRLNEQEDRARGQVSVCTL